MDPQNLGHPQIRKQFTPLHKPDMVTRTQHGIVINRFYTRITSNSPVNNFNTWVNMLKNVILINNSKYSTYLKPKNIKTHFLFYSYTEPHLNSKGKNNKKK